MKQNVWSVVASTLIVGVVGGDGQAQTIGQQLAVAAKAAGIFLLVGALARALMYLALPISQYGNDAIGFDAGLVAALPFYFVLFRAWVAALTGMAVAYALARRWSTTTLGIIALALPLICELLMNVGLIAPWFELGVEGARVGIAYLGAPLVGGVGLAAWTIRRRIELRSPQYDFSPHPS